jgi:hypothetical protein
MPLCKRSVNRFIRSKAGEWLPIEAVPFNFTCLRAKWSGVAAAADERPPRGTEMKRIGLLVPVIAACAFVAGPVAADPKPMPEDAKVYIIWPADGQVIAGGKFWVRMGLSGAGVAPAGVEKKYTGHHHLLVDTDLPPLDQEIPNDKNHLHYGLGQTEVRLELPPGRHTLQLLFADDSHLPHNPPLYSKKITIIVPP